MLSNGKEFLQISVAVADREAFDAMAERVGVRRSILLTRILTYAARNPQVVKEAIAAAQAEELAKLDVLEPAPAAPAAPPSKPSKPAKRKAAGKSKR